MSESGTRSRRTSLARRGFLKGAAAGGAALVAKPPAFAQEVPPRNATARPNPATLAPKPEHVRLADLAGVIERPGQISWSTSSRRSSSSTSASNPGSTFDSLHESLINYGENKAPEFLTCCHEESAVAMAHGYAKIEGKPMMALIHGTVGTSACCHGDL